MRAPTQHLANQNGAASKKAHGVDSLNGGKCTELGPHPYASSPLQPYKKIKGDPPRLAGIRPESWFLDRSLLGGYQQINPSCKKTWTCHHKFVKGGVLKEEERNKCIKNESSRQRLTGYRMQGGPVIYRQHPVLTVRRVRAMSQSKTVSVLPTGCSRVPCSRHTDNDDDDDHCNMMTTE